MIRHHEGDVWQELHHKKLEDLYLLYKQCPVEFIFHF